jgi:hypothetical protein
MIPFSGTHSHKTYVYRRSATSKAVQTVSQSVGPSLTPSDIEQFVRDKKSFRKQA